MLSNDSQKSKKRIFRSTQTLTAEIASAERSPALVKQVIGFEINPFFHPSASFPALFEDAGQCQPCEPHLGRCQTKDL